MRPALRAVLFGVRIPTYAAFIAAETARATGGAVTWATTNGFGGTVIVRSTAATVGGIMEGSVWSNRKFANGSPCRVSQHAFPSQAVFDAYVAAGRMVTFTVVGGSVLNDGPFTRNGYTSEDGGGFGGNSVSDFRYYDDTLGPVKMNPFAGTGPTPYTLGT